MLRLVRRALLWAVGAVAAFTLLFGALIVWPDPLFAFSLGSGKISGVVASPYGYHVFKLLGRRGAKTRSFKEVQAEAERRATAEKRAQAERQLLDQLRSSAEVKINDAALTQVH